MAIRTYSSKPNLRFSGARLVAYTSRRMGKRLQPKREFAADSLQIAQSMVIDTTEGSRFRVTQVVDIVRSVHAMIQKNLFTGELRRQIALVWHATS